MLYELFLWLKPGLSTDQVKKEFRTLEDFVSPEGKFESRNLGKKRLSYKIKGFEEGLEFGATVSCSPPLVSGFKTILNHNESVLRYLLTKVSKP